VTHRRFSGRTHRLLQTISLGLAGIALAALSAGGPVEASPRIGPAAPVASAPAEEVRQWTLTPAASAGNGNRAEFSYSAAPGTSINDAVTLFNLGNTQLTFRVYAADAFTRDDGTFDVASRDAAPTGAGGWVALEQDLVTVPAGQQVTIPIVIAVPADAEPGDHAGGILASVYENVPDDPTQPVKVEFRTGTRLYLRVDGDTQPSLGISDLTTSYDAEGNPTRGTLDVTFRIVNRGNVRLGGTATITVNGPFGLRTQEVVLEPVADILPGSDVIVTTRIPDVAALGVIFTTVRLVPDAPSSAGADGAIIASSRTIAPPWVLLAALGAVVLALVAGRVRRRRLAPLAVYSPVARTADREVQTL
jgi:hypothetical protein